MYRPQHRRHPDKRLLKGISPDSGTGSEQTIATHASTVPSEEHMDGDVPSEKLLGGDMVLSEGLVGVDVVGSSSSDTNSS